MYKRILACLLMVSNRSFRAIIELSTLVAPLLESADAISLCADPAMNFQPVADAIQATTNVNPATGEKFDSTRPILDTVWFAKYL